LRLCECMLSVLFIARVLIRGHLFATLDGLNHLGDVDFAQVGTCLRFRVYAPSSSPSSYSPPSLTRAVYFNPCTGEPFLLCARVVAGRHYEGQHLSSYTQPVPTPLVCTLLLRDRMNYYDGFFLYFSHRASAKSTCSQSILSSGLTLTSSSSSFPSSSSPLSSTRAYHEYPCTHEPFFLCARINPSLGGLTRVPPG